MKFLGRYKAGATIRYSVQFHNDSNTTVDPTNPAARYRKPDDTFDDLAAPAKLDTKTGWYGGSIDTTGFAAGSHEVRITGTVDAHEVGTVISFEVIANTHADIMTKIPSAAIADYKADVSALAIEGNVEGHVTTALGTYDGPTKTEMDNAFNALNDLSAAEVAAELATYDGPTHAEMTAEHNVLEAEHAVLSGEHGNLATPAQVNTECDQALADYDGPTKAEMDAAFAALNDPTAAAIADAVWNELLADHQTLTTFGGAVRVMQALAKQNIVYDTFVYDGDGNLTSMRIRLFDTAAAATAATSGGSGEGDFESLTVSGTFTSEKLTLGKVVKA